MALGGDPQHHRRIVEGEGRHQADQRGVVRGGAGADGEEPSRRSVSSNVKSEHPHLLPSCLRCHECGTELWSQTQSSEGKTYYKSLDRGMSVIRRHQGRSFVGWRFEEQVERLFEGFRLREDWIDWIIEHHVKGQDHTAAIQKRHSIQTQV